MRNILIVLSIAILTGAGCTQNAQVEIDPKDENQNGAATTTSNNGTNAEKDPAPTSATSSTKIDLAETILTEADFNGFGLIGNVQNRQEEIFRIQIAPLKKPQPPVFAVHVLSFKTTPDGTTVAPGYIEIFKDNDRTNLVQKIELDPNMWLPGEIPLFFTVQDINFDGYADIGIAVEGGAKWGSYQYWVYDKEIQSFVTAHITEEFRKLRFNAIKFDKEKKQIKVGGFLNGIEGSWVEIYQYEKGDLRLIDRQEKMFVEGETEGPLYDKW